MAWGGRCVLAGVGVVEMRYPCKGFFLQDHHGFKDKQNGTDRVELKGEQWLNLVSRGLQACVSAAQCRRHTDQYNLASA